VPRSKRAGRSRVLVLLLSALPFLFSAPAASQAPSLGSAETYAVLAGSTVTSTGPTMITGDLGVSPGTAVTGLPPGTMTGTLHAGDALALRAQGDLTKAYNALAGAPRTATLTGQDLGGRTLTAGVYAFAASAPLNGVLTLDAQNNPNAVFVFQIGSTLLAAINSSVRVINGAQDANVFWLVGSSATLAAGVAFRGNIIALSSITLGQGARVSGRALARTAAVTMDSSSVFVPVALKR
jgi:type VI secretion system secreted protein VgrG